MSKFREEQDLQQAINYAQLWPSHLALQRGVEVGRERYSELLRWAFSLDFFGDFAPRTFFCGQYQVAPTRSITNAQHPLLPQWLNRCLRQRDPWAWVRIRGAIVKGCYWGMWWCTSFCKYVHLRAYNSLCSIPVAAIIIALKPFITSLPHPPNVPQMLSFSLLRHLSSTKK